MKFQSSPGPRAGRCLLGGVPIGLVGVVSILARPEGRALLGGLARRERPIHQVSILARPEGRALPAAVGLLGVVPVLVSILARPEGRALPFRRTSSNDPAVRFQSSPGPRAGRCQQAGREAGRDVQPVSILARPEGRALREPHPGVHIGLMVSILARPEGRALRGRHDEPDHRRAVSILARPEGRALPETTPVPRSWSERFNPRPARGPGAA